MYKSFVLQNLQEICLRNVYKNNIYNPYSFISILVKTMIESRKETKQGSQENKHGNHRFEAFNASCCCIGSC